ncbi:MAG: hypothetical protein II132_06035 [Desulfovibrio sp.]|nr:hypothetical protein [Desulfovibrio sp.]
MDLDVPMRLAACLAAARNGARAGACRVLGASCAMTLKTLFRIVRTTLSLSLKRRSTVKKLLLLALAMLLAFPCGNALAEEQDQQRQDLKQAMKTMPNSRI